MEQGNLKKIENELSALRKAVEKIQEYLIDDEAELEISDEVLKEVEESRKNNKEISNKDVVKEFLE